MTPGSPKRIPRPLAWCVLLLLAAAIADYVGGKVLIEDGQQREDPWPPFATFSDPELRESLAERISLERARSGAPDPKDTFDRELGWIPRPGPWESPWESGVINSIGARGSREYPPLPTTPSGAGFARIVCVGDSFVFGSEVSDDATWPARLEEIDAALEVINLGVGGYGTDQALLRYRQGGSELGASIAIVGLALENIGRNVSRLCSLHYADTLQPAVKPRFVLSAEGALELLGIPYESRVEVDEAALDGSLRKTMSEHDFWAGDDPWPPFSRVARVLAAKRAAVRRKPRRMWEDPDGEPYRVTLALLETFKNEALAAGASHALVLVMPNEDVLREFRDGRPAWFERFTVDLDARGIEYLDTSKSLLAAPEGTRLYLAKHFSPEANTIVANAVLGWLHLDPVFR